MAHRRIMLLALASAAAPVSAQVQNAGFETGSFAPWAITNTPNGTSIFSGVGTYDIDGPGPQPTSRVASFMVGRTGGAAAEGITISQGINFAAGSDATLSFNWSVHSLVNVYNQSGGIFELLVNGVVLNQATAPVTAPGLHSYGQVSATFHAPATGTYTLAVRVTRNIPAGEEVNQFVDNILAAPACKANCDYSSVAPILNANDFACFLNSFAFSADYANCDGSTNAPVLNANDFQCFLNAYAAACT